MALTKVTGSVIKDSVSLSGNVSVGGTLTYQDVTNVDALGIGTFRTGIKVLAGQVDVGSNIKLGNAGVVTATTFSTANVDINTDKIVVGTGVTIEANQVATGQATFTGIVTASAFKLSDGSNVGGVESDGSQNTVGGTNAGDSIVSGGTENTVFGYNAGTAISTGDNNTFFGSRAGRSISTGLQNTGVGYNVMGNTSGTGNAALGQSAGNGILGGSYNVALGWSALSNTNNNGTNNIVIGKTADISASNVSNEVTIGNLSLIHI